MVGKWEYKVFGQGEHPTAIDIIKRENVSLRGKTVLVTGASGIGEETIRAFAAAGARVFALVRSVEKAHAALDKINAEFPQNGGLEIVQGDFTSLESVNAAANDFLKRSNQLNILVNNAGVGFQPFKLTEDGFESTLAIDHISHHLLFKKVAPLLIKSSSPDFQSRVVVIASAAHLWGDIDVNDMNYTHGRQFDPVMSYSQAKFCNVLFANQVERLYGSQGVHAISLHPGLVLSPGALVMNHDQLVMTGIFKADGEYIFPAKSKTMEQGATTPIYAAVSKELEGKGGVYVEDMAISKPNEAGSLTGYNPAVLDEDKAAKLWDWTEKAVSKFVKE